MMSVNVKCVFIWGIGCPEHDGGQHNCMLYRPPGGMHDTEHECYCLEKYDSK